MSVGQRSVRAVYLTYALQSMGQAISWQFVTYFVKHELDVTSFLLITLVWAAPAFVTMVAVNVWGSASDNLGRRRPFMIIGFIGYAVTFALYSLVTNVEQYFAVALVGAAFSAAALPVGQAYLTSGISNKGERLGYFLVAQSTGWLFGALVSGLLYDVIGMYALYRISALLCVLATGVCVLYVQDMRVKPVEKTARIGLRRVLRQPGMIRLVLAAACSAIGINSISYIMAIMIVDELGGLTAYVGLANAIATAIAALITGYIGKLVDRKGPVRVMVFAYLSYALFAVGFALAQGPLIATILYALPIYPLASTAAYALGAVLSRDEERGRAMGLVNGAQNAGAALGPVIGGLSAEFVFGRAQPISWINMVFNLLALILALSLLRLGAELHSQKDEDLSAITRPV
jgi:MFS family permease